jgi:hypothetical protein
VTTSDRLIVACLLAVLIGALTWLSATGHDSAVLVGLCGPAVSGLFGLLLYRRVLETKDVLSDVAAKTELVVKATNGVTTGRFDSVDAQLVRAGTDRAANAAADRIDDQDARDDRATGFTGTAPATS